MECPHCHRQTSPQSKTCRFCAHEVPPAQHLLEESGIVEPAPYAAADSYAEVRREEVDESDYRMAGLGDRFIAFSLDTIFLFGVFAIVDAWAFMRWGIVDGSELKLSLAALLIAEFLNALIFFVYLWLSEALFGATLGKAMVGIRVVRVTDRNPLSAFAIRNLLRIVDGLGFYLVGAVVAGCSRFHRRVGDVCAGTAVIEDDFGYTPKIAAIVLWIAVTGGAIWSVPRICSTNLAVRPRYLSQVVVEVGRSESSAHLSVAGMRLELHFPSASQQ